MIEIVQEIETTDVAGKLLGQRVAAPKTYSPDILVPVARTENRDDYGITNETFVGYDTWNCYEISFLFGKGMPLSFVGKLVYPSTSPNIVESKSLKLYLNSFNMENMGETIKEAQMKFIDVVREDLSKILGIHYKHIGFYLFGVDGHQDKPPIDGQGYFDLMTIENLNDIQVTDVKENPSLLKIDVNGAEHIRVYMNAMRSNCRVTHQPDWATIFIDMKGKLSPDLLSILQYIVSFRDESHFHEECVEMVYKRLWDMFHPDSLNVTALYTRRGGIDICPQRASSDDLLHKNLVNEFTHCQKTIHQ